MKEDELAELIQEKIGNNGLLEEDINELMEELDYTLPDLPDGEKTRRYYQYDYAYTTVGGNVANKGLGINDITWLGDPEQYRPEIRWFVHVLTHKYLEECGAIDYGYGEK